MIHVFYLIFTISYASICLQVEALIGRIIGQAPHQVFRVLVYWTHCWKGGQFQHSSSFLCPAVETPCSLGSQPIGVQGESQIWVHYHLNWKLLCSQQPFEKLIPLGLKYTGETPTPLTFAAQDGDSHPLKQQLCKEIKLLTHPGSLTLVSEVAGLELRLACSFLVQCSYLNTSG